MLIEPHDPADYKKYSKAHTYLTKNKGCHFILTNTDRVFPSSGEFYPGALRFSSPLNLGMRAVLI
jgi:4-nitrophenyl phosphatase